VAAARVVVIDATGKTIGQLNLPERFANVCFGGFRLPAANDLIRRNICASFATSG
jgi:sugar lactone lactonase YvrE